MRNIVVLIYNPKTLRFTRFWTLHSFSAGGLQSHPERFTVNVETPQFPTMIENQPPAGDECLSAALEYPTFN